VDQKCIFKAKLDGANEGKILDDMNLTRCV